MQPEKRSTRQGIAVLPVPAPLLSVIVPVYNEARTVEELLLRVMRVLLDMQVIVVDDASSDGIWQILERWRDSGRIELLRHERNRGKGAAIRTGLERARGRFTIVQDADLEYDPEDYARVIAPLERGEAQVVYGSRYGADVLRPRNWSVCRAGVSLLNLCVWWLYGQRLTDEATCYKAFPTELLRRFCPEVTAKLCRLGLTIHEVPIRYQPRSVTDGKKIRWRDGAAALACLWRWRRWEAGDQP